MATTTEAPETPYVGEKVGFPEGAEDGTKVGNGVGLPGK